MDWNRVEGNWKEVKGKIKQQWGQLTDNDLAQINGRRDQLEGENSATLRLGQGSGAQGRRPLVGRAAVSDDCADSIAGERSAFVILADPNR